MNFDNSNYQQIINEYPELVSKEQFYQIAHISKRTAQYLLQSKKVPCTESGKKTRKYKIKVSDIVTYLIDRELRPEYYLPCYSEKSNLSKHSFLHSKKCFLSEKEMIHIRSCIIKEFEMINDILTIKDVSNVLGLSCKTVSRKCVKNEIHSFLIGGKRIIPKICLVDYLSSTEGFVITKKILSDSSLNEILLELD